MQRVRNPISRNPKQRDKTHTMDSKTHYLCFQTSGQTPQKETKSFLNF